MPDDKDSHKLSQFSDRNFSLATEDNVIASFDPEAIASAIEQLGWQFAVTNQWYEQAKHKAEKTFADLTTEFKPIAGSVSGAEAIARSHQKYQDALKEVRQAEADKIKAQSSFKAAEAYSKMAITKVSAETKVGDYYRKNLVT